MSSLRHPVGPEKPGVYWRRRAVAFGALVLVVLVIVLIVAGFARGGASSAAPTASASAGSGPSAGKSTKPSASTSASGSAGSAKASSKPATSSGKPAACEDSQIELAAITDKTSYGPTEDPKIAMSITNTGSDTCHMDLGSAQQVLTISSGEETYWTSKDCQTGGTNQDVELKAGQKLTTPSIGWDRTRSSTTTCDSSRPSVTAGGASYHLQVAVGSITSKDSAQFILN